MMRILPLACLFSTLNQARQRLDVYVYFTLSKHYCMNLSGNGSTGAGGAGLAREGQALITP